MTILVHSETGRHYSSKPRSVNAELVFRIANVKLKIVRKYRLVYRNAYMMQTLGVAELIKLADGATSLPL